MKTHFRGYTQSITATEFCLVSRRIAVSARPTVQRRVPGRPGGVGVCARLFRAPRRRPHPREAGPDFIISSPLYTYSCQLFIKAILMQNI